MNAVLRIVAGKPQPSVLALPANLERPLQPLFGNSDPQTTASVPQTTAPVRLQGKVFVHVNPEPNELPFELRQQVRARTD